MAARSSFVARAVHRARKASGYLNAYLLSACRAPRYRRLTRDLESLALFIGYPRSGSSLIGALLDAHPEMIFAHELNALTYVRLGFSRQQLLYLLISRSEQFAAAGSTWAGYSYAVPNQWNGRVSRLRVIGDKKAGDSAFLLRQHPDLLDRAASLLSLPLKLIHVVRNPYDMISTRCIRSGTSLQESADYILARAEAVQAVKNSAHGRNMLDVHLAAFIARPREELCRICDFLGVEAGPDYLADATSIVFESPQRSRHRVQWPDELRRFVQQRLAELSLLQTFSFDSD